MSFFSRLIGRPENPRDGMRPLWHAVVETSRERAWYANCGVADSVEGRFDMISVVLALVLLRMEQSAAMVPETGPLTELFVEDMDRQLRDTGVGDLMVGKKIVYLMGALGGRTGALREAFAEGGDVALAEALARNVTLLEDAALPPMALAARVRELHAELAARPDGALQAGELRR